MSLATILDDLQQSTDFGKLKSSLEALAFAANITTMAAASPSPSPSPHHHHASSGHWDAFQAALRSHEISSSSSSSSEPRKRTGTIKESKPTQEQEQFFKGEKKEGIKKKKKIVNFYFFLFSCSRHFRFGSAIFDSVVGATHYTEFERSHSHQAADMELHGKSRETTTRFFFPLGPSSFFKIASTIVKYLNFSKTKITQ